MIAYLDSSVLLRVVFGQRSRLAEWAELEGGVVSALVEVECLRTLDRERLRGRATAGQLALLREAVFRLGEEFETVDPSPALLRRAAGPLPVPLGALDAIHLVTALLWREAHGEDLLMATHDERLALAARASGLRVVGTRG